MENTEVTVEHVLEEVKKDMVFYEQSGGGVTLSGGEILLQPQFALEILKISRKVGINTAIETCGYGKWEDIDAITGYTDQCMFDLKIMDDEKHKQALGVSNRLVHDNFIKLVEKKVNLIPRVPLVPEYTATKENLDAVARFLLENGKNEIHILPFHQFGSGKYESLNMVYQMKDVSAISEEEVDELVRYMTLKGLNVVIGGK